MEQWGHDTGQGIDSTQVCSLEQVALLTAPRQIFGLIRPTVLSSNHMIEMKRCERQMPFVNVAVFATEARLSSNLLASRLVQQAEGDRVRRRRAWAWRMAQEWPTWTVG